MIEAMLMTGYAVIRRVEAWTAANHGLPSRHGAIHGVQVVA